jgi:hypothetical protein
LSQYLLYKEDDDETNHPPNKRSMDRQFRHSGRVIPRGRVMGLEKFSIVGVLIILALRVRGILQFATHLKHNDKDCTQYLRLWMESRVKRLPVYFWNHHTCAARTSQEKARGLILNAFQL